MKFYIEGTMNLGNSERKFSKEIEELNENLARERVFTQLGSSNGVKRGNIKIEKVEKV